jgi:simple sugar transport system permease protein
MVEVLLTTAVLLTTPLLLASLGEIVAERAGILNIGTEGVMLFGAFAAAGILQLGGGRAGAAAVAVLVGCLLGLLLAGLFVARAVNQVVGGVLFNLLALGLTTALFVSAFETGTPASVAPEVAIPGLSSIPVVGPALFDQPLLVYVAVGLAGAVAYLIGRTWLGLHLRAAGQRPEALDSAGVSVGGIRTAALVIGCALAALGGACIVLLQSGAFTPNLTEGQGYIALGIALLARWSPIWALPAVGIFGLAQGVKYQAGNLGLDSIPPEFLAMLPYAVAIVAVTVGTAARYPAALGIPYSRE